MFGLPTDTTIIMLAVPIFWIAYTAVFFFISRDWHKLDEEN